jgi:hypothetical protein
MKFIHSVHPAHFLRTDLGKIDVHTWLCRFASSMVWIFAPVLMLKIGYSLSHVFLFLFIYYLIESLLDPLVVCRVASRIGNEKTMLLGILFNVLSLAVLYSMNSVSMLLLVLLGLGWALTDSFYWVPLYDLIMLDSDKKKRGEEQGLLLGLMTFMDVLGPIFGATLLVFLGKEELLFIAAMLMVLSSVPLFRMKHGQRFVKRKGIREMLRSRVDRKLAARLFLRGIQKAVECYLWPIFVFLALGSLYYVGYVGSLIALGSAVFFILIGKVSDSPIDDDLLVKIGGLGLAISWVLRYLFGGPDAVAFMLSVTLFAGFMFAFLEIPLFRDIYNRAEGFDVGTYAVYTESLTMLPRAMLFLALFFAAEYYSSLGFLIAALANALVLAV